jgi:hypothetical protein
MRERDQQKWKPVCRTNVFVCPEIALQNIEIAHDLVGKPLPPSGHARGHALADQTQEIINLKN